MARVTPAYSVRVVACLEELPRRRGESAIDDPRAQGGDLALGKGKYRNELTGEEKGRLVSPVGKGRQKRQKAAEGEKALKRT